jgi:hypothetical protein
MSYFDADDFHSAANKAKMSGGQPLTDADRKPWLEAMRDAMRVCTFFHWACDRLFYPLICSLFVLFCIFVL